MDNSILFSIESILSRRDPPSPLSAIQQLVDKLPAPRSSHRVLGERPSERDVKNAEAEQTPQKRTGIFRKHQLFGLVLEFELKKLCQVKKFPRFLKDCNLVNPKLELGFKTDEQNGGEKEC